MQKTMISYLCFFTFFWAAACLPTNSIFERAEGYTCKASTYFGTCQGAADCPGFSSPNWWCGGYRSPTQCCFSIPCGPAGNRNAGICRSTQSGCNGGSFTPGLCPGGGEVQCCIGNAAPNSQGAPAAAPPVAPAPPAPPAAPGNPGAQGTQGTQGTQGAPGAPGSPGATGTGGTGGAEGTPGTPAPTTSSTKTPTSSGDTKSPTSSGATSKNTSSTSPPSSSSHTKEEGSEPTSTSEQGGQTAATNTREVIAGYTVGGVIALLGVLFAAMTYRQGRWVTAAKRNSTSSTVEPSPAPTMSTLQLAEQTELPESEQSEMGRSRSYSSSIDQDPLARA